MNDPAYRTIQSVAYKPVKRIVVFMGWRNPQTKTYGTIYTKWIS